MYSTPVTTAFRQLSDSFWTPNFHDIRNTIKSTNQKHRLITENYIYVGTAEQDQQTPFGQLLQTFRPLSDTFPTTENYIYVGTAEQDQQTPVGQLSPTFRPLSDTFPTALGLSPYARQD